MRIYIERNPYHLFNFINPHRSWLYAAGHPPAPAACGNQIACHVIMHVEGFSGLVDWQHRSRRLTNMGGTYKIMSLRNM